MEPFAAAAAVVVVAVVAVVAAETGGDCSQPLFEGPWQMGRCPVHLDTERIVCLLGPSDRTAEDQLLQQKDGQAHTPWEHTPSAHIAEDEMRQHWQMKKASEKKEN